MPPQTKEVGLVRNDIFLIFRNLDIDGDGEITVEEFISGYLRMRKTSGLAGRVLSVKKKMKAKKKKE